MPSRNWEEWLATASSWLPAVERAYVDAATRRQSGTTLSVAGVSEEVDILARAAAAAVAARYLAIGTPRTLGLIGSGPRADGALGKACVETHALWNAAREVRCADSRGTAAAQALADACGGQVASVDRALACDIVCLIEDIPLSDANLRSGTHISLLTGTRPRAATGLVTITAYETPDQGSPWLGQLAAGLVDGRQRDEITLFVVGPASIAASALPQRSFGDVRQ